MLGFGLDAFRQHRQLEASAKTDDRTHDRHGVAVVFQVANKGTVDLDLVEGERVQIRQGGISRSEVIQGDLHAERLEPIEDRYRARKVVDQNALGDFEFEAGRRQAGFEQNGMNEAWQVAMVELDRRDVDGNGERPRPGCGFTTGLRAAPIRPAKR